MMGEFQSRILTFADTYMCEEKLGEGSFGQVFKVRHKTTNECFALKVIQCRSNEDLTNVIGEMKAVAKLSHPNIIKLYDTICKQKESFTAEAYLVFEYCTRGNLNNRLRSPSSKQLNSKWMRQLADAVSYLHSQNLVHRDLKPENILLTNSNDAKLGDFGLSRDFVTLKRQDETWESYYMKDGCGTLFYLAPEVFSDHYTEKADVFALGLLFYAIEERGYFELNGRKCYGAFVRVKDDEVKLPLGFAMSTGRPGVHVTFIKTEKRLANIIGSTLLFDQKKRPDAATIKEELENL